MSTLQIPERPVFNSMEPGLDSDLSPPVSFLAVLAMLLGIVSLTAALSTAVIPFAVVVAIFSAALIWRLSWDTTLGGLKLAQIGLCCAVLGSVWGFTAVRLKEAYYYSQAQEHAKLFLENLSAGKKFDAFELTRPESDRQVTGTDIETHYEGLLSTTLPTRNDVSRPMPQEPGNMPSNETMKFSKVKEELEDFFGAASTKEIMAHGKDAKWEFVRGDGVTRVSSNLSRVAVVMVDSANPSKKFQVSLNRALGQYVSKSGQSSVAIWDVDKTQIVTE